MIINKCIFTITIDYFICTKNYPCPEIGASGKLISKIQNDDLK